MWNLIVLVPKRCLSINITVGFKRNFIGTLNIKGIFAYYLHVLAR